MIMQINPSVQALKILKDYKVKLSVSMVSKFILDGLTQSEIARACNCSPQWVHDYIKLHYDDIAVIVDPSGKHLALKSKTLANGAINKLDSLLTTEIFTKKDIIALNILAGTQIDKFRLLNGESTENISMTSLDISKSDLEERRNLLKQRIAEAKRVPVEEV